MHQLTVDRDLCSSYGCCVTAAPDIFDIGEDDIVVTLAEQIPDEDVDRVLDAVESCPVGALRLETV